MDISRLSSRLALVGVLVFWSGPPAVAQSQMDPELLAEFDLAYGRNGADREKTAIGNLNSVSISSVRVGGGWYQDRDFSTEGIMVDTNDAYDHGSNPTQREACIVPKLVDSPELLPFTVRITWPNCLQGDGFFVQLRSPRLQDFMQPNGQPRKVHFTLANLATGRTQSFAIRFQIDTDALESEAREAVFEKQEWTKVKPQGRRQYCSDPLVFVKDRPRKQEGMGEPSATLSYGGLPRTLKSEGAKEVYRILYGGPRKDNPNRIVLPPNGSKKTNPYAVFDLPPTISQALYDQAMDELGGVPYDNPFGITVRWNDQFRWGAYHQDGSLRSIFQPQECLKPPTQASSVAGIIGPGGNNGFPDWPNTDYQGNPVDPRKPASGGVSCEFLYDPPLADGGYRGLRTMGQHDKYAVLMKISGMEKGRTYKLRQTTAGIYSPTPAQFTSTITANTVGDDGKVSAFLARNDQPIRGPEGDYRIELLDEDNTPLKPCAGFYLSDPTGKHRIAQGTTVGEGATPTQAPPAGDPNAPSPKLEAEIAGLLIGASTADTIALSGPDETVNLRSVTLKNSGGLPLASSNGEYKLLLAFDGNGSPIGIPLSFGAIDAGKTARVDIASPEGLPLKPLASGGSTRRLSVTLASDRYSSKARLVTFRLLTPEEACPEKWNRGFEARGSFCLKINDGPFTVHGRAPECRVEDVAAYAPGGGLAGKTARCVAPNLWRFDDEIQANGPCGRDWACNPKLGLTCVGLGGDWKLYEHQPPCTKENPVARFPDSCHFQVGGVRQESAQCDPEGGGAWLFAKEWEERPRAGKGCDDRKCWSGNLLCLDQGKGDGPRWFDAGPERKTQPRCEFKGQTAAFSAACDFKADGAKQTRATCDPDGDPVWLFASEWERKHGHEPAAGEPSHEDPAGKTVVRNTTRPKGIKAPGDPAPGADDSCDRELGPCDGRRVCLKVERDGALLAPYKLYPATQEGRPDGERGDKATFAKACPFAEKTAFSLGGKAWVFESEWEAMRNTGSHPGSDGGKGQGGGGGGPARCDPEKECLSVDEDKICLGSATDAKEGTWRGPVDLKKGLQPRCAKDERVSYGKACTVYFKLEPDAKATCVEDGRWVLDSATGK